MVRGSVELSIYSCRDVIIPILKDQRQVESVQFNVGEIRTEIWMN